MIPIGTKVKVIGGPRLASYGVVKAHDPPNQLGFVNSVGLFNYKDSELEIIQEEKPVPEIASTGITYSVPWSSVLFMTIEAEQTVFDAALAKFVHHTTVIDGQTIVSPIEYEQNDKGLLFHANVVPKIDLTKARFINE